MHLAEFFQTADDKRFEQDQSHLFRQAALVELEFGTDDDDGTSRVVDSFAQKVHPETSGLPLQHVGQGFQGTVSCPCDCTTVTTVIHQGIDRLL